MRAAKGLLGASDVDAASRPPRVQSVDDAASSDAGDAAEEAFLREAARAPAIAPSGDLVGATLGRYRILRRLGEGGMGVVYAALDPALQRSVAIKVLPAHRVADPERRRRFLREARLAAAVAHPSIAAIHDVGESGDRVFFAMELVAGETLRARLAAEGSLPIREVARIGREIARGLAEAHAAGVIHRDIKPDNVMIGAGGRVKILDFGLAKLREADAGEAGVANVGSGPVTQAGRLVGTPGYLAPEQARGLAVDLRADVFSLGAVLYELVTGAPRVPRRHRARRARRRRSRRARAPFAPSSRDPGRARAPHHALPLQGSRPAPGELR